MCVGRIIACIFFVSVHAALHPSAHAQTRITVGKKACDSCITAANDVGDGCCQHVLMQCVRITTSQEILDTELVQDWWDPPTQDEGGNYVPQPCDNCCSRKLVDPPEYCRPPEPQTCETTMPTLGITQCTSQEFEVKVDVARFQFSQSMCTTTTMVNPCPQVTVPGCKKGKRQTYAMLTRTLKKHSWEYRAYVKISNTGVCGLMGCPFAGSYTALGPCDTGSFYRVDQTLEWQALACGSPLRPCPTGDQLCPPPEGG